MTYHLLTADSAEGLDMRVNSYLREGWRLHGGAAVAMAFMTWEERNGLTEGATTYLFSQAMTKEDTATHGGLPNGPVDSSPK